MWPRCLRICNLTAVHKTFAAAGTILVALADKYASDKDLGESNGVLGDAFTLAAAALYACYTIMLKQMMPEESEHEMLLFFAYLGALNIAMFGPIVLFMQLSGAFDIWAVSWHVLALALVKGAQPILLTSVRFTVCFTSACAMQRRVRCGP